MATKAPAKRTTVAGLHPRLGVGDPPERGQQQVVAPVVIHREFVEHGEGQPARDVRHEGAAGDLAADEEVVVAVGARLVAGARGQQGSGAHAARQRDDDDPEEAKSRRIKKLIGRWLRLGEPASSPSRRPRLRNRLQRVLAHGVTLRHAVGRAERVDDAADRHPADQHDAVVLAQGLDAVRLAFVKDGLAVEIDGRGAIGRLDSTPRGRRATASKEDVRQATTRRAGPLVWEGHGASVFPPYAGASGSRCCSRRSFR